MPKPQLFCFTYAGGSAAFFDSIDKDITGYDLVKMEYAGHGTRRNEPCYQSFEELAEDLYAKFLANYTGHSYALFGYSMGTIALVEVLRRIIGDRESLPDHVFLAAHEPHTKSELVGFSTDELDEWVKRRTIQFGAIPQRLIDNRSFWRVYLPLYRADYSIIGKYRFEDLDLETNVPATIFYSEQDTPRKEIELWKRYFRGECRFFAFVGNHFFIQQHHKDMARIIDAAV